MRILVASNNEDTTKLIERYLSKWGYEFISTPDGNKAWELYQQEQFGIILSDWILTGIDGLELCRKIRAAEKAVDIDKLTYSYFIMCTDKKDTENIVEGIESGADDYIILPFDKAEFKVRIKTGLRLLRLGRSLASTNARLRKGLSQAAMTLTSMLPASRTGPDLHIEWIFQPCTIIGGDLFNVLALDKDHICIYAINVSGNGAASALFAVTLGNMLLPRRHIDSLTQSNDVVQSNWNLSPRSVVSTLNRRFPLEDPANSVYSTLFYAVINRHDLKMKWVRAGHPHPMVSSNKNLHLLAEGDPPIGVFHDHKFTEYSTQLHRGDRLFIYSDGITEAKSPSQEMFGIDRLKSIVSSSHDQSLGDIVKNIETALYEHNNNEQFDDDLSLLAVEIT